jgi:hypothetical protein
MTIVWDQESSLDRSITTASTQMIQPETVLFKVGRRLWKSDIGPVPLRHAVVSACSAVCLVVLCREEGVRIKWHKHHHHYHHRRHHIYHHINDLPHSL